MLSSPSPIFSIAESTETPFCLSLCLYSQDYDRVVGVYPVLPQSARVIEYQGRPYLRYQLGGGNWAAIEFEDVGILNQYQYKNDFFGETNRALNPTMQLLNAQNAEQTEITPTGAAAPPTPAPAGTEPQQEGEET